MVLVFAFNSLLTLQIYNIFLILRCDWNNNPYVLIKNRSLTADLAGLNHKNSHL